MSWYNNNDTSFIDATQIFEGGSGNIIGGDGNGTGESSVLTDILELKLDHFENEYEESEPTLTYNLYLKNNNIGGEIRFYTLNGVDYNDVSNNNLEYNSKIGTNGKLYLYYKYNPLISALIFSGWTDVIDYIVGNRQATINNSATLATTTTLLQSQITTLDTALVATDSIVATNVANIGDHELRISAIETKEAIEDIEDEVLTNYLSSIRDNLSTNAQNLFDD